jgi:competence protein ComEC
VRSVALLPSIALLAGTLCGAEWGAHPPAGAVLCVGLWAAAALAWVRRCSRAAIVSTTLGYVVAGAMLGAAAADAALRPSLRAVLDTEYGGFVLDTSGPPGPHDPVLARVRLLEDAAVREFGVSLDAKVEAVLLRHEWRRVDGGVRVTISGTAAVERATAWRAGRVVLAPITFRRPARYLNDGVPDHERELALRGVTLFGSVKSGMLVEPLARGSRFQELAADLRAHVRAAVQRWIGARDPVAAAIATAILIGDRTTLPDEVRDRLQAAGTYHVIAISGGNIAILAALIAALLFAFGASGRVSALVIMGGLAAYAAVVSGGPSVVRATLTAIVYLAARLLDHRSPPWNAMAVSAALLACASPLDVRDVGFALTFGATGAILEAARRARVGRGPLSWIKASVAASFATELVLLPIAAMAFSRATIAGVVLNLLAVPLMTLTQLCGLAVVVADGFEPAASAAGMVAAFAAGGLVESARLVELLPWLAVRVPPPVPVVIVAYYVALAGALWVRPARAAALVCLGVFAVLLLSGVTVRGVGNAPHGSLRLTMFDVGQGDAMLLQLPHGPALMVDAGGAGFDGTGFDIGGRVLARALWARGVVRLDALAITHADPDHIGGALALVRDFAPAAIWEGVEMPSHGPSLALAAAGRASGAVLQRRRAGWTTTQGGVSLRVLHPPAPDWERQRVRNDDSLVIELRYGDVSILLTGDAGADVERAVIPMLAPARLRILKVGHHGSRTSTSQALLDAWRPHAALISCGRGNRFGHPAPDVMRRLEAAGAHIYRTDRHGQITLDTDGHTTSVRTFLEVGDEPRKARKPRK